MAFVTIDASQIEVGKPVRKELWQTTKDNFDDIDTRIAALEAAGSVISVFNLKIVNLGQYSSGGSTGVIAIYEAPSDLDLIEAQIYVIQSGSSGTLQMDVLKGADISSLSSMMTVKPSITSAAGDEVRSSNQDFATTAVAEGELIAIEFNQLQTGMGQIAVKILGEPA